MVVVLLGHDVVHAVCDFLCRIKLKCSDKVFALHQRCILLYACKAVTRGVFWVFEHPKFQGKIRHTKIVFGIK